MAGGDTELGADKDQGEEVLYAPEEKFANPRDHMGRTATDVKSLCGNGADCRCPVCDHKLIVRAGDKVATHFAHAKGRADTSCKGGFETPWHRCAKIAAGMREGWLDEFTDKTDRHSRFDAYNPWTQEAFEAVHSLSATYVEKQRSLAGLGISCQWLFDSAGDFANRNPLPLDIDKAACGLLECHDLLRTKAIDIILEIGEENCFLHYLGLAWKWVGVDRWQACSPVSSIQKLCTGERGINRLLIDLRARGDMPEDKLAFRNGELVSTAWNEITPQNLLAHVNERRGQLLETWRRVKKSRESSRRSKAARQYRPSTHDDVMSRSKPVCELAADRASLTEKLNSFLPAIESPRSESSTEDRVFCLHKPVATNNDSRGWVRYECRKCGKWLGYSPSCEARVFNDR